MNEDKVETDDDLQRSTSESDLTDVDKHKENNDLGQGSQNPNITQTQNRRSSAVTPRSNPNEDSGHGLQRSISMTMGKDWYRKMESHDRIKKSISQRYRPPGWESFGKICILYFPNEN